MSSEGFVLVSGSLDITSLSTYYSRVLLTLYQAQDPNTVFTYLGYVTGSTIPNLNVQVAGTLLNYPSQGQKLKYHLARTLDQDYSFSLSSYTGKALMSVNLKIQYEYP